MTMPAIDPPEISSDIEECKHRKALREIDEIVGNQDWLDRTDTSLIRKILFSALNETSA